MLGAEAWGQIHGLLKGRVPMGTAGSQTGKLQPSSRPAEPGGKEQLPPGGGKGDIKSEGLKVCVCASGKAGEAVGLR